MRKVRIFAITLATLWSLNATAGHHEENRQSLVGVAYSMSVNDPQAVVAAMRAYWTSPTGNKNKGYATLRQVIAGGENPATHIIAVAYPSYEAMDEAMALNATSEDAATFYQAINKVATVTSRIAFDASGLTSGNIESVTNPLPVTAYFMMDVSNRRGFTEAFKKAPRNTELATGASLFEVTADGDLDINHGVAVRANDMASLMSAMKANRSDPKWLEYIESVSNMRSIRSRMITKDLAVFGR